MLLPATPATGDGRAALGAALRAPGVAGLLVGVLAFMAAFYGLFAERGTSVVKSIFRRTDSSTGVPHPLLIISASSACRHGHPAPLRERLTVRELPGASTIPNAWA
jgi:hypothetical protein